jgi:hypothetical protein
MFVTEVLAAGSSIGQVLENIGLKRTCLSRAQYRKT